MLYMQGIAIVLFHPTTEGHRPDFDLKVQLFIVLSAVTIHSNHLAFFRKFQQRIQLMDIFTGYCLEV